MVEEIRGKCEAFINGFTKQSRRIDEKTDEMKKLIRDANIVILMLVLVIGLELATFVMLPQHPVCQPAYQTIPNAR